MKHLLLLTLLLLQAAYLHSQNLLPSSGQSYILTGASVWDGVSSTAPIQEILIINGTIHQIATTVTRVTGVPIVNLTGHHITPGFIDSHVHLTLRPEVEGVQVWSNSPGSRTILGVQALALMLSRGFTTVRDLSASDVHFYPNVDLSAAVDSGMLIGPKVIVAPHIISASAGHGDVRALLSIDNNPYQVNIADGTAQLQQVVRKEIGRGATWIKFAASGGFSTPSDDPTQTTYTQDEMNAITSTAADLKVPVCSHSYGDESSLRAINANVTSLEHGNMMTNSSIQLLVQKGIYIVPTQVSVVRNAKNANNDYYWATAKAGSPAYVRAKYIKYGAQIVASAGNLAASNAKIVLGTDLGSLTMDINNAEEFVELVANGIGTLRAMKAGTSLAAQMLGLNNTIGMLKVGYQADIVAMPGDPFSNITMTTLVDFVMKNGTIYKQPALTALLNQYL